LEEDRGARMMYREKVLVETLEMNRDGKISFDILTIESNL